MPKPPKAAHTGEAKSSGQHSVAKLRLYEILYTLNQGFEQVLGQLQQLERLGLGRQPWYALRVMVEENRAEINFELWTSPAFLGPKTDRIARSVRR